MSLAFDENGRPFIILREQDKKKRVKGLEAHKVKYTHTSMLTLTNILSIQFNTHTYITVSISPECDSYLNDHSSGEFSNHTHTRKDTHMMLRLSVFYCELYKLI